jgi:hypothetical protein
MILGVNSDMALYCMEFRNNLAAVSVYVQPLEFSVLRPSIDPIEVVHVAESKFILHHSVWELYE